MKKKVQIKYKYIEKFIERFLIDLSDNEKEYYKKLENIFTYESKYISTLVKIIIIIEEDKVKYNQELGKWTLELINILPSSEYVKFRNFAKKQRLLLLNTKLQGTFYAYSNQIKFYYINQKRFYYRNQIK